jgi:sulfate adenylyltransferase subunit 1
MELLRLITAGSVDDGKSTLIGRLLYDTKALLNDQLRSLERSSKKKGLAHIDFSLVTDGLKDELEQGITIDIAHRYFSTERRKYIIADTPGHVQYTRNFVTAASTANLGILLIDARKGVTEQTRRHALIASIMGVKHLVFCINKMDLVNYSAAVFEVIKDDIEQFTSKLEVYDVRYIPISALHGENIVERSIHMQWYTGSTLLDTLETIHISSDRNLIDARFPVQHIIRVNTERFPDYRAYAGQVASGTFRPGDEVVLLPSGMETKISRIMAADGETTEATTPMSVSISLEDEIDVSRGDMIVKKNNKPQSVDEIDSLVCALAETPLVVGSRYILRHATRELFCVVKEILYVIDVNTYSRERSESGSMRMNEVARIRLKLSDTLYFDAYKLNRTTGSAILVDPQSNNTIAACTLLVNT